MTYRPTPDAIERDARELTHVLMVALHRMDLANYPPSVGERMTAGTWVREVQRSTAGQPKGNAQC